jgi:lipopolysaccharide export LptBFGC system permease protein LptF
MKKRTKNRKKAIFKFILILLCVGIFFAIIDFFLSKITGFETQNIVPGSSTVGHPLITSYKEGLNYIPSILIKTIIACLLAFIFFFSTFVNFEEKRLDQKDKKID